MHRARQSLRPSNACGEQLAGCGCYMFFQWHSYPQDTKLVGMCMTVQVHLHVLTITTHMLFSLLVGDFQLGAILPRFSLGLLQRILGTLKKWIWNIPFVVLSPFQKHH